MSKARQSIRKRINAARRARAVERDAERLAALQGEIVALERRKRVGLSLGGVK